MAASPAGRAHGVAAMIARLIPTLVLLLLATGSALAQAWPRNPDFAEGGNPPAQWFLDPAAEAKGRIAVGQTPAGPVLELSPNARNTPSDKPLGLGQLLPAAPFRGREVTLSASLSGTGGASAVIGLVVLRKGGGADSIQIRDDGATELTQRQDRLTVPDDRAIEGLILFVVAEGTTGMARVKGVSVVASGGVAAAEPAPAARSADYAARVQVDTSRVVREIPRGIFGTNIEVIRDANGLWDSRNQRIDPTLSSLARDMRLSLVRFPGGVWSDAYDWRHGVGPMNQRATTPTHPGAEEKYRHVFGTDEALAFAQDIGAGLLVTVNAGTGTPEMAADWVRYVNGADGKSPRAGRVAYWEIGNELYMKEDMSGGHMTPERYADRLIAFSRAMRAVDPSIRIAAIGLRNYGRYRFADRDDWNEVVLRRAGAEIDVLAVHNAYSPLVGDGKGFDPADVYAAMWAAPTLIARNLKDTWRDVERFAPTRTGAISLAITEWGPLFAVSPGSPWIDHVKTLGSAVFVASVLQVFAEDPHVSVANFFKLNEASFMGWVGRSGGAWTPTAPYHAFRMVSTGMEPNLLPATVTTPVFNSRTVGFVDRVSGAPTLDSFATRSADGKVVTVLLINRHVSAAAAVTVALDGIGGAASVRGQTLTGASVDANTGTELPRVPGLNWARQKQMETGGRFDRGAPAEIRIETADLPAAGSVLARVPPHSITLLRFQDVRP